MRLRPRVRFSKWCYHTKGFCQQKDCVSCSSCPIRYLLL